MNYFEFYKLPVILRLDKNELKKRYIEVSKHCHPDFFTQASKQEKERILEMSTMNNEAYQTLSNDEKRLAYILKLRGVLRPGEHHEIPHEFLVEMMDLNEKILEARLDSDSLELKNQILLEIDQLEQSIRSDAKDQIDKFDRGIEQEENLVRLKDFYLKSKYVTRIRNQLKS